MIKMEAGFVFRDTFWGHFQRAIPGLWSGELFITVFFDVALSLSRGLNLMGLVLCSANLLPPQ